MSKHPCILHLYHYELAVLLNEYSGRDNYPRIIAERLQIDEETLNYELVNEALRELGYLYSIRPGLDILTPKGEKVGIIDEKGQVEWLETLLPELATVISKN